MPQHSGLSWALFLLQPLLSTASFSFGFCAKILKKTKSTSFKSKEAEAQSTRCDKVPCLQRKRQRRKPSYNKTQFLINRRIVV